MEKRVSWFDYVNSFGIVGALGVGAYQTRRLVTDARQRDAERRVERAIELYRDLVVEGDTAASFNRLSVLLRNMGAEKFKIHTWYLMDDTEFLPGNLLDPALAGVDTAFQDLYRVLWFFERTEAVLNFGLAEQEVMFQTIGFHCWWWGQLLWGVRSLKASDSIHRLAPLVAQWARENSKYELWVSRCTTDFGGAGPREI
jgi:hypothetical protein